MSDRTVATDALETLGTVIGSGQGRDAIHLAVEPIEAADNLIPGQHVGIAGGKASASADKKLGIVDPFIGGLLKGQWFWLVVYPRKITSLRHVWAHPDFAEVEQAAPTAEPLDAVSTSKKWIEDFANKIDQTYNRVIEAAREFKAYGEWTYDNSESYKIPEYYEVLPEFWRHYAVVTGEEVEKDYSEGFFTCSC